jgi:hypothetical protein
MDVVASINFPTWLDHLQTGQTKSIYIILASTITYAAWCWVLRPILTGSLTNLISTILNVRLTLLQFN